VEEKKSKEIPLVAASEKGEAHLKPWRKPRRVRCGCLAYVLDYSSISLEQEWSTKIDYQRG